jgi:hypothetical protein
MKRWIVIIAAVVAAFSCVLEESVQQPLIELPALPSVDTAPLLELPKAAAEIVLPTEFRKALILGLDGEFYLPYRPKAIERIQQMLTDRGLYGGPVNGILDESTMEGIYLFQKATYNLPVSGVPTPRTRRLLQQGSHTDLSF